MPNCSSFGAFEIIDMSCKICGRGACTESFHSLEAQEAWEDRQTMSDDVDDLRREIQDLNAELKELRSLGDE